MFRCAVDKERRKDGIVLWSVVGGSKLIRLTDVKGVFSEAGSTALTRTFHFDEDCAIALRRPKAARNDTMFNGSEVLKSPSVSRILSTRLGDTFAQGLGVAAHPWPLWEVTRERVTDMIQEGREPPLHFGRLRQRVLGQSQLPPSSLAGVTNSA